jgi:hypothetical protein
MGRFSGPQGPGASRRLDTARRAEAEQRQAAERARDRERAASRLPDRPLTDREVDELLAAARTARFAQILNDLSFYGYERPSR